MRFAPVFNALALQSPQPLRNVLITNEAKAGTSDHSLRFFAATSDVINAHTAVRG